LAAASGGRLFPVPDRDLRDADAITCYLLMKPMPRLARFSTAAVLAPDLTGPRCIAGRPTIGGIDMANLQKISPCLWFDSQAEDAARYYVSIFRNASVGAITRFGKEGFEIHGQPEGRVLTVNFVLEGVEFLALNGGPHFKFNEAVSLVVYCDDQPEVDYYWDKLRAGGDPSAQQCGWLKDRYGLSWQIVPTEVMDMWNSGVSPNSERAMKAMMQMKKLDIAALRKAYDGAA
jgi:predicted 3-demethylubiquinone-9 3-methyltransferase (glyoxalase superfamily)